MKKLLLTVIFLSFITVPCFADWQQAAPGMAIGNIQKGDNWYSVTYKYTGNFVAPYKKINPSIDYYLVDVNVNCSAKTSQVGNANFFDASGNKITSLQIQQPPGFNALMQQGCSSMLNR